MLRRVLLCLAILGPGTALAVAPAHAPSPGAAEPVRALRERSAALRDRRERQRNESVSPGALVEAFLAHADSCQAAGLDSLAAQALFRAAGLDSRAADTRRSESLLRRAVALAARARDTSLEVEARELLATLLARRDPEQGLALYRELTPILERRRDHVNLADNWTAISRLQALLGRLDDAARSARIAERHLRPGTPAITQAYTYVQLTQSLHALARDREALPHADRAVARGRASGSSHALAMALTAKGNVLRDLGRGRDAGAALEEAMALDRRRGDTRHLSRVRLSLCNLLHSRREHAAALPHADTLVQEAARLRDVLFQPRAISMLGLTLAELGRFAEAETLLANALPRFERVRAERDEAESQAGLQVRGGEMYATLARVLVARGRLEAAWRTAERGRSAVLRRQLAGEGGVLPEFTLATLRARLGRSHTTLLQWVDPQRNPHLAFVLSADTLVAVPLGMPSLAADAALARELIAENAPAKQLAGPLTRLSQAMLEPLRRWIPAGTQRLLIVPVHELQGLPLELLPIADANDAGATLGDRFAIAYVPSGTALLALERTPVATEGMAVFADPDLSALARSRTTRAELRGFARKPLRGAREEARDIAVRGAHVWLGSAATAERLESPEVDGSAVLHFATHAWVNPAQPDSSGLLLAGRRGLLTAAAVESLTLRADLVVLSGCRTGLGRVRLGEGTFGLQRSFLIAGARSVVGALWDVDDRAAQRFMGLFHEGLRAGKARDVSLREARQRMLDAGASRRDASAFVLTGVGDTPVRALAGRERQDDGRLRLRW